MSKGIVTARLRTNGQPMRCVVLDGTYRSILAVIRACDDAGWFTMESGLALRYRRPGAPQARRAEVGDVFVVNAAGEATDVLTRDYFARYYTVDTEAGEAVS